MTETVELQINKQRGNASSYERSGISKTLYKMIFPVSPSYYERDHSLMGFCPWEESWKEEEDLPTNFEFSPSGNQTQKQETRDDSLQNISLNSGIKGNFYEGVNEGGKQVLSTDEEVLDIIKQDDDDDDCGAQEGKKVDNKYNTSQMKEGGACGLNVVPVEHSWIKRIIIYTKGTLRCYFELWKTRLSTLVLFTTLGGYYSTGGWRQGWKQQSALAVGTFLQAAAANSLNEIMEVDRDAIMQRTRNRPLPTKRISKTHAFLQSAFVGTLGTYLLYRYNNSLTASLGAANILLYAGVYTPMKVKHWINTWIGTINGSLPPLMGCAASSNQIIHPTAFYMFSSMYLWQITHFMAICYKCRKDYESAGYKMLSINAPQSAANQAVFHSLLMFPLCWSLGPWGFNVTSWWFPIISTPINYYYLLKPSIRFQRDVNYNNATRLFFDSLKHLSFLFFAGIIAFATYTPAVSPSAQTLTFSSISSYISSGLSTLLSKLGWNK